MNVLLSIKPKYVDRILSGMKKYEFRKVIFREPVHEVVIYSSCPVKKIIGKFRVGKIIEDTPENLWLQVKEDSGLNTDEFFSYFQGKEKGFAIGIDEIVTFNEPIDPWVLNTKFTPPQSFQYIEESCYCNE